MRTRDLLLLTALVVGYYALAQGLAAALDLERWGAGLGGFLAGLFAGGQASRAILRIAIEQVREESAP